MRLLYALLALPLAATAAPTRTTCACSVIRTTPSAAHWTPLDPTPTATPNACASLAAELSLLSAADPVAYAAYVPDGTAPQSPLSTTDLLRVSEARGADANTRIVCSETSIPETAYADACTLWFLQLFVLSTLVACIAEALYLFVCWLRASASATATSASSPPFSPRCKVQAKPLRLPGGERLLCAFPAAAPGYVLPSPGAEKKAAAYEGTKYFLVRASSGRREFVAYESEDDDESNRPVL